MYKKMQAISWALFDFANSSYSIIILTFVFPIFFKDVIAGRAYGDFYWGLIASLSILISGILAPLIGAVVDYSKKLKFTFIIFALFSIIGTALLYFSSHNLLFLVSSLFIVTNLCYNISLGLYDSFLPYVSTPKNSGRVSGLGYGFGYLGGFVALILLKPLYESGYNSEFLQQYKLTFALAAAFFLFFALPMFFFVRGRNIKKIKGNFFHFVYNGFSRTLDTIKKIKKHKEIVFFIIALYLLSDALYTIFGFISIYAKDTLLLSIPEITSILLLIHFVAFPSSIFLGWLSDKKGYKKVLLATIVGWIIIISLLSIANSKSQFYLLATFSGIVIGGSQAIPRAWFAKIIPHEKLCEFFGFNSLSTKIAGTIGPLIFGSISSLSGNQRIAMLSLLPLVIAAFFIFAKIRE